MRVTISPEAPTTADDLVATIEGRTGPGFRWSVNGGVVPDATTSRIAAALTTRNEVWKVEALQDGVVVATAEVTIVNSAPTPPVISVPSTPIAAAPIPCRVDGMPTDLDGDPVARTVSWTVNGEPFTGATMTAIANDTVPPAVSHTGSVFECTVTASDSQASTTATARTTVAPRIAYLMEIDGARLRKIDLDTRTISDVGPMGVQVSWGDLAWDRNNQKLYMVDGHEHSGALYTVDTSTGMATRVGTHGLARVTSLAFNPADNNQLYMIENYNYGKLHRINPSNASVTFVGNLTTFQITYNAPEGLIFDSKRSTLVGSTPAGYYYKVDVSTPAATQLGVTNPTSSLGLTYDPFIDRFWVADASGRLISIDPNGGYGGPIVAQNLPRITGIALALPPP